MKNRFVSIFILFVAVAFIAYIVVDNSENNADNNELLEGQPQQTNEEQSEANESSKTIYHRIDEVGLNRGMIAPDFTLPLWGTDEKVTLSSYQGQIVVLNLWASWCPPCREEMPDLNRFHNDYKDQGVTVLGVNMLMSEANQAVVDDFLVEYEITFPNLIDQSIGITNQRGIVQSKLYNAASIPRTYIIDEKGYIFVAHNGVISYELIEDLVGKVKNAQYK